MPEGRKLAAGCIRGSSQARYRCVLQGRRTVSHANADN